RAADRAGGLEADDLEGLAEAAWWNGRSDECIAARERAYTLHLEAGRPRRAALVATALAKEQFGRSAPAIGQAWLNRAERLLQDEAIGVEHGYLTRLRAMLAVEDDGGLDRALELARETVESGTRFGSRDLMALGLQDHGPALIGKGERKEGMPLLREPKAAARCGGLAPSTSGIRKRQTAG